MEFEKVMKLIDAGFTADEIRAMNAKAEAPKDTPKEAPKDTPKEAPKEAPADRPKEEAKAEAPADEKPAYIKELEDHVNELFASMDKLSKVIVNPSIADVKPVGIEDVIKKILI